MDYFKKMRRRNARRKEKIEEVSSYLGINKRVASSFLFGNSLDALLRDYGIYLKKE